MVTYNQEAYIEEAIKGVLMQKDCDLLGSLTYFNVLPIVAIIFLLLAHKGISHDRKLLNDSGRIR